MKTRVQICSRRSAQTQTSSQTNTAAGVWWMMLSSGGCTSLGRRTNFVPSTVDCLSFLVSDEPGGDSGKQCSVSVTGVHNTSRSSSLIVCHPHGSVKVRWSARWWWITYKDWKSSWVSCFLLCRVFIITRCVESSVSRAASGNVTDTGS